LRGRRRLAGQLAQRSGEIGPGQPEQAGKIRRQHAAVVEKAVDRSGDVHLVLVQAIRRFPERRGQVQEYVVCAIAQTGVEIRAAGNASERCSAKAAICVQDRIAG
jgi:hypothetical protein